MTYNPTNANANDTRNFLSQKKYIISNDLHYSLESGILYKDETQVGGTLGVADTNKFYVLMIKVLNKDSRSLVYNYISYPYEFYYTFMWFLCYRSKIAGNSYVEPGQFLSIIDKSLGDNPVEGKFKDGCEDLINLNDHVIDLDRYRITYIEVFRLINKLVMHADICTMSQLVDIALKKDYKSFAWKILGSSLNNYNKNKVFSINRDIERLSIINGCVFIVKDLEKFILSVRDNNYNLNAGPQPLRGQVNSINNFLSMLDMEYRKSLYNHNNYHSNSGYSGAYTLKLSRDKFSFNNIHMNIGGVRWYSTKVISKTSLKSTNTLTSKKSVRDESYIFNQLGEFLNNLPVNEDTQLKIENFLSLYSAILYEKKEQRKSKNSPINYDLISNNFTKLLKDKEIILIDSINNTRNRVYVKKPSRNNELILYYLNNLLKDVGNSHIISIIYGRLLRVININNKVSNTESSICLDLGRELVINYYYCLYKNHKSSLKDNVDYTMSDWKKENTDKINIYNDKDDKFTGSIGGILVKWMLDLNLVEQDWFKLSRTESHNILLPTEEVSSTLKDKNNMIHLPHNMPMIVKPKLYSRKIINGRVKERLGGYLLNDVKYTDVLIKSKWNLKEPSSIRDENVIYDLVNNINSVGFKINRDVLDFIDNYDRQYNLISTDDYEHLLSKPKLNKPEYIELESFLSKRELQENILGLARAYSKIHEFYLPVRLDFRGRVNCISEYLNYQSNELAKSLLLFSKPEKIGKTDSRAIGYLKAYGANCYGNKLDKKSWNERIDWIDNNLDNIINFRNGELISQSDNKLLFIAFCFEYNRLIQSLGNNESSYFETYLPIRLDATCNGYQHLALLSLDHNLAKQLNLTKSTWNDPPKDFYSFIGSSLVDIYKNKLASNISDSDRESYTRLAKLEVLRAVLKKAVMTKPYNTTPTEMINKIQESFEVCGVDEIPTLDRWYKLKGWHDIKLCLKDFKLISKIKLSQWDLNLIKSPSMIKKTQENYELCDNINEIPFLDRWYKLKNDHGVKLKERDFILIRSGIEEILNKDLFKIKKLMKYLDTIAKILIELNLFIPWGLPNGVDINQSYLSPKEIRLKPFTYSKRTFSLIIPDDKKGYNKLKQKQAFMPNLVHSLDAASLALLIDLYFNNSKYIVASSKNEIVKNIFTIHDCFAVTANNVENVMDLLKFVYIKIYSESNYLRKLDKGIIDFIKLNTKENSFDISKLEININGNTRKYPNIEGVLGTDSSAADFILNSSYIVH